jgi:hypothetical protein
MKDARRTMAWTISVLDQFFRVSSRSTYGTISLFIISRIFRLMAFLLPLKVILLAGSDGVPRYFRPFLSPEYRDEGILFLSTAAILAYVIALFLDGQVKRLSEHGSANLLAASGIMWVVNNQRSQAQGFYALFTSVAAELLFAFIGLVLLAALNPILVTWVFALAILFSAFTVWALDGVTPLTRTWISDLVNERLGGYLSVLSSIAFLSSFLVILYPFLAGPEGNILIAIISIVLLRQVLASLTGAVKDVVALWGQRQLVDTLVFPDRQLQAVESKDQRTLRNLFGRQQREEKISEELATLKKPEQSLRVEWLDVPIRGMAGRRHGHRALAIGTDTSSIAIQWPAHSPITGRRCTSGIATGTGTKTSAKPTRGGGRTSSARRRPTTSGERTFASSGKKTTRSGARS